MTEAARGAQASIGSNDLVQQFVGVQRAFHEQLGLAAADQSDRPGSCRMRVRCILQPERGDIDARDFGGGADLVRGADKDGLNKAGSRTIRGGTDRSGVTGMHDGGNNRLLPGSHRKKRVKAVAMW